MKPPYKEGFAKYLRNLRGFLKLPYIGCQISLTGVALKGLAKCYTKKIYTHMHTYIYTYAHFDLFLNKYGMLNISPRGFVMPPLQKSSQRLTIKGLCWVNC